MLYQSMFFQIHCLSRVLKAFVVWASFILFSSMYSENLWLINGYFFTVFGNLFANYMNIFHKTEVQTVISGKALCFLRCLVCTSFAFKFSVLPKTLSLTSSFNERMRYLCNFCLFCFLSLITVLFQSQNDVLCTYLYSHFEHQHFKVQF